MFTLPPLPPKDYVLRDVRQTIVSNQEHSPDALPRVTQANLAKYCFPIEYKLNEPLGEVCVQPVHPIILNRWVDQSRAWWVEKPGKDAEFLHEIYRKYTVPGDSNDPRFLPKEKVFNRPFSFEDDCKEYCRLKKVRDKILRDNAKPPKPALEEKLETIQKYKLVACEHQPPFWWKSPGNARGNPRKFQEPIRKSSDKTIFLRWQEEPDVLRPAKYDFCQRRTEMALVGQCFRNEACNWYYRNYPPPNLRRIVKKFT